MSGSGRGDDLEGPDGIREEVSVAASLYEERGCWRCSGGRVHEVAGPAEGPRFAPCPECGGTARVSVYLYPKARSQRRGRS